MPSRNDQNDHIHGESALKRIDSVADRFDAAWQAALKGGPPPQIESFLGEVAAADEPALRRELELLDQEYRERLAKGSQRESAARDKDSSPQMPSTVIGQGGVESHEADAGAPAASQAAMAGKPHATSSDDKQPATPIRVVGEYEVLEEIGHGGMGVVYKAKEKRTGRSVALKMILAQRASHEAIRRFVMEAEMAANLDHPHIVPIYHVGEHQGQPYFCLKFVDGLSLAQAIKEGRIADARHAAKLVETISRAVQFAHNRGILHRDLKPANILIDEHGEPHVTDFGLAKRLDSDVGLTQAGAILGTPAYMAPEQTTGQSRLISVATDVYALGAILFELLTGRPPFQAEDRDELYRRIQEEPTPSPRSLSAQIHPNLEIICLKCLEKDPASRYASAELLADDLRRHIVGEPIHARPAGHAERFWRWCQRNRLVASLVATAAGLLVAVTIISTVSAVRLKDLADRERNETKRANRETSKALELVNRNVTLAEQEKSAREKAELSAIVAREQSQLALKSLEFVIGEIQRKLRNVPGAGDLQRSLLKTALARLQDVSDQFASRDAIDRNTAVALTDLGDTFLRIGTGTPSGADADGPLTAARKVYQQAFDIAQKLAAADPSSAQALRDLSIAYNKLGNVQRQSGQVTEALKSFNLEFEISKRLAAADPSDAQAQRDLSKSYLNLGDVQLQSGQVTKALGSYQKGLEICQKLAAADPNDARTQRDLYVSYFRLGDVQLQSGQVTDALGSYQQGLEISQKLAAANPSDAQAQLDLSISYETLGNLQLQSRQVTESLGSYQQGLEIRQKLAAADPSDAQTHLGLFGSHYNIGLVQQKQKQYEQAIESFGRGLKVLQSLKEQKRLAPANAKWIGVAEQSIQQCRHAAIAMGDWKTLLEQPVDLLPELLDIRKTLFYREGRTNDAVQAVSKLRELGTATANQLFNAARIYSLCAAGIKAEKDELTAGQAAERQKHIADALETLREAIKTGFKDFAHLQKDTDLTVLRDLPEFKALLPK